MTDKNHPVRSGALAPWMLWTLVWLTGGAVVAGIFLWPDDSPQLPRAVSPDAPVIEITGVEPVLRDKQGRTVWALKAGRITLSASRLVLVAEDVRRGVYYRDGKPFLIWQAKRLNLNNITRDVTADGEVSATGPDGFSIRAAKATWSHEKQEVRCDAPVKATLRGATFTAPGLIYQAQTGRLLCSEQSHTETKGLAVDAARVSYDTRTGILRSEQAHGVTQELTIDAGSVVYDTRSGLIRCAQVSRAVTHGFTISAADVSYDMRSGVLRCGRDVNIETSGATLRGGSAVVDTRARKVSITNGLEVRVQPDPALLKSLPNLSAAR